MPQGDLTGSKIDEYVLGELIGGGAQGAVYRAVHPRLERPVAIKILREERRNSIVARWRFLSSARLASRLDHPNAAHIYDCGVFGKEVVWIAMELVSGVPLDTWLATQGSHGAMSLELLVPFLETVAEVLHSAHQLGIVHRDIKPSNIMVVVVNGRLVPKLLDFGIAKASAELGVKMRAETRELVKQRMRKGYDEGPSTNTGPQVDKSEVRGLTGEGERLGSARYMSPEQWDGSSSVGPSADIYALGVLVYRLLVGHEPFVGIDANEYEAKHKTMPPPRLGGELAGADHVVQRCLAKAASDRYPTALEVAADLRTVLQSSEREQLRTAAQQWDTRRRSPSLLWGQEAPAALQRLAALAEVQLGPLERSFVADSQRQARRARLLRGAAGLALVVVLLGALVYRDIVNRQATRSIEVNAQAEEGRHALLHGELAEARDHLTKALAQGGFDSTTAWMLDRAEQPRRAELAMMRIGTGRGMSVAWSRDGTRVVVAGDDGAALWDPVANRRVATLDQSGTVYAVAYAPSGDFIATVGEHVRIWTSAGALVRELNANGHKRSYQAVAWTPAGDMLAAVDQQQGALERWDVATGNLMGETELGDGAWPSIAASAHWITASMGDRTTVVAIDGAKVVALPVTQTRVLAQDPTGDRVAIATTHGGFSIWDLSAASPRKTPLREAGGAILALAWSPDGERLAAANGDNIEIWSTRDGGSESSMRVPGLAFAVAWADDSRRIAAGLLSGEIFVIDRLLAGAPTAVLTGHERLIMTVEWSPHGDRIASASLDGSFRIWSGRDTYRRWQTRSLNDDCGIRVSPVPDDRFVIVPCLGAPTRVWDALHGALLGELPPVVENDGVAPLPVVSSDGTRAAIAHGNRVEIYALPGGAVMQSIEHSAPVTAMAWGPAGLVSGDRSGSFDGRAADRGAIDALAVLPDGRVVVADANRGLSLTGAWRGELSARARILRVSPDGRRIAVITSTAAVPEMWDVGTGRRIAKLDGPINRTWNARWTADGQLLTSSADGAVRRWSADGTLRMSYSTHGIVVTDAVEISGLIIGAPVDGVLRWWDEVTGHELWTLATGPRPPTGVSVDICGVVVRDVGGAISRWSLRLPDGHLRDCGTVAR